MNGYLKYHVMDAGLSHLGHIQFLANIKLWGHTNFVTNFVTWQDSAYDVITTVLLAMEDKRTIRAISELSALSPHNMKHIVRQKSMLLKK
jgi:hypothetical protein